MRSADALSARCANASGSVRHRFSIARIWAAVIVLGRTISRDICALIFAAARTLPPMPYTTSVRYASRSGSAANRSKRAPATASISSGVGRMPRTNAA